MGIVLSSLLAVLETIAPLELAEDWDNVGLLVDPRHPGTELFVERILLTIDATSAVVREAIDRSIQCLIAYHPPLFQAKKRLSAQADVVVFESVARGWAVYSPHTALDAAPDGINDWLTEGLGRGLVSPLAAINRSLPPTIAADPRVGAGRILALTEPVALSVIVDRVKSHLQLSGVRLASSEPHAAGVPVGRVAVCAGAGGELFGRPCDADLFLTGEMRHHQVLEMMSKGKSVILCEHTNTERGYLSRLRERLLSATGGAVDVAIASSDREPLCST